VNPSFNFQSGFVPPQWTPLRVWSPLAVTQFDVNEWVLYSFDGMNYSVPGAATSVTFTLGTNPGASVVLRQWFGSQWVGAWSHTAPVIEPGEVTIQEHTVSLIGPSTYLSWATSDAEGLWLDNVTVEMVPVFYPTRTPEPATWTMLAMGVAAIILTARRRLR
jgi:hypothetical protein